MKTMVAGQGRMLVLASPGGLEHFFAGLAEFAAEGKESSEAPDFGRVAAIAHRHGIEVVGPPLA